MSPEDVGTAITNALVQGGSQWLIATIVAFLPVMWTMTLMLHLGRPYVLRTLQRCGLRLGADVWWMSYLLLRDGTMVVTFAISWIFFQPNLVTSLAFPITGPLAALLLLATLAVKVVRKVDDNVNDFRLATVLLVAGATLYYAPLAFAIEAASQEHLAGVVAALTSSNHPTTALTIMWISLAGVTLILGFMFVRSLANANRAMVRRMTSKASSTTSPIPNV
jgi:hypothetical protein